MQTADIHLGDLARRMAYLKTNLKMPMDLPYLSQFYTTHIFNIVI